ncbi:hypothetical protein ACJZ2D_009120 [Fusarium nematophilum]
MQGCGVHGRIHEPCITAASLRQTRGTPRVIWTNVVWRLSTNCLQTGSECIYPTPDQTLPSNESSPSPSSSSGTAVAGPSVEVGAMGTQMTMAEPPAPGLINILNNYVGGSFDALPEPSKRLLRHFSQYTDPKVIRESRVHAHVSNAIGVSVGLGYGLDGRGQDTIPISQSRNVPIRERATPETRDRTERRHDVGDFCTRTNRGELDASSRHLKGIQSAVKEWNRADQTPTLPQRMLKMVGDGLRTGRSSQLVNVPEYQPTFMALLFASIWDITALPPREAPRYGWWEDQDTQAARLWQNHTRDLNLNYEISRAFNPTQYVPRILNGDPKSSRTSFIATFFYLCSELGHKYFDVTLIDWLLEQLIDDVNAGEEHLKTSAWTQSLWLWCVMFGAAIASTGRASNMVEQRQLAKWRGVYSDKMRLASRELGINSWQSAKALLAGVLGRIEGEVERGLEELWNDGIAGGGVSGENSTGPAVVELMDSD